MFIDKIIWLLTWPAMIAISYFAVVAALKWLDKEIKSDPTGDDLNP